MTASKRINSHTDINMIDKTRGNITVEGGDLLVNERNIDRQTHTHHIVTGQKVPNENREFLTGHLPFQGGSTQPQHMITQLSRDTTLPIVSENHKRTPTDHSTSVNRLAKAIAGIASHQRPGHVGH